MNGFPKEVAEPRPAAPSKHEALTLAAEALEAQAAALRALALDVAEADGTARQGAIRVQDLAKKWGVGLTTIYDLVTHKHLRAFRVGTAICIPLAEVASYERRRTV